MTQIYFTLSKVSVTHNLKQYGLNKMKNWFNKKYLVQTTVPSKINMAQILNKLKDTDEKLQAHTG